MNPKPTPSRGRRFLRVALFGLLALVTLAVLAASGISFQGRRDWAKTKADLLARGEKLSFVEFAPAPIPDDQNFFGDSMWKELAPTEEHLNFGVRSKRPKLPPDQRQLRQLTPDLAPAEIAALNLRFKDLGLSRNSTHYSALTRLTQFAKHASSPVEALAAAQAALAVAAPMQPLLARIAELARRPGAVPFVAYADSPFAPNPYIFDILAAGRSFGDLAAAALLTGDPATARRDIENCLNIAETLRADPFLISLLVRISLTRIVCSDLRTGIERHAWTDADLAAFERRLRPTNFPAGLARALRAERGSLNQFFERLQLHPGEIAEALRTIGVPPSASDPSQPLAPLSRSLYWRLFRFQDQAYLNRALQARIDLLEQAPAHALRPAAFAALAPPLDMDPMRSLLSLKTLAAETGALRQVAYAQSIVLQTRLACALERYRLKNRTYPAALAALVPEFLPAIPRDVLAGEAFRYRPEGPDKFRLWSIGWNGTDEGGKPGTMRGTTSNGDWVWNESSL